MNRLLLFLLGLILLGLLAYFCISNHAPTIEDDLSTRATAALNGEGLNWVQTSIAGRELKLTGIATSAELRERAGAIASSTWGIDSVNNQITVDGENTRLTPSEGDYQTQFLLSGDNIVLNGMVPDLKAREKLIAIATQRFGSDHVIDQLRIQSTTAPTGWKQAAHAALSQLRGFSKGSVQIINSKMQVTGVTATDNARTQIQLAINNALPSGYQVSFDIAVANSAQSGLESTGQQRSQKREHAASSCQERFDNLLTGQHILFKLDSDIINTQSNYLLDQLMKAAKSCPDTRIEIGGHTDSQGSDAYNTQLSRRRAKAVARYLSAHGISKNRLTAIGYGESSPISDNQSIQGRANNRRIEFKVVGN
ncbi:MAG: OmpA family protein [Methylococcales bacterium]